MPTAFLFRDFFTAEKAEFTGRRAFKGKTKKVLRGLLLIYFFLFALMVQ